MFATYYYLTKPGIIYGNLLTTAAGFLLAARGHVTLGHFVGTLLGVALVIGSACVYNNYIDRGIDRKMARTKKRALAQQKISGAHALVYATILGAVGFTVLAYTTNTLTVLLGSIAFFDYVVLYGVSKRGTAYSTLIGSIAGALPIAAGYTAASGTFDVGALLLFSIMTLWQMPHFYAIAMYRASDYAAAGLPVLAVSKGMRTSKIHAVSYMLAFSVAVVLLWACGYTGYAYLGVMTALCLTWLFKAARYWRDDDRQWGKRIFLFSLIVVTGLSVMVSIDFVLP